MVAPDSIWNIIIIKIKINTKKSWLTDERSSDRGPWPVILHFTMLARFSRPSSSIRIISTPTRTMSTLTTRPQNWKIAAPPPLPGTTTFAGQASLAKLPVPELSTTLTRLKESLKPHAKSDDEYAAAVAKIDEFGEGKGKELHEKLLKKQANTAHWLENWWDDLAYQAYRDSVYFY